MKTDAIRSCVFCGAAADSKEHVFAKRLCTRAGAEPVEYPIIAAVSVDGKETASRKEHPIGGVQVRHVCVACNNGWMNDLESWFENRLGFLIEPHWPALAVPMIEEVRKENAKLAQWLMKTAVMFSLSSFQGEHRVDFAREVTLKIKDGILPKNLWVDLAYSEFSTVGGTMTRCFQVINGGKYYPSQVLKNGDGFKFYVQYNHLLLRIAQAPNAEISYRSWRGELPVRLYPIPFTKIPNNFAYDHVMKFEHALILETWKGCRGLSRDL